MGWGARFAGVLVAGAVLASAAACGGAGPEGQALPAATSGSSAEPSESPAAGPVQTDSSSPTVSPDPSGSTLAAHSVEGAEAYVRRWITLANAAFASGDVESWTDMAEPSCKACAARADDVVKAYADGGSIDGGKLEIADMVSTPIRDDAVHLVTVDADASPEVHRDSDGKVLSKDAGGPVKLVFFLRWSGSAWSISEVKVGVEE